MLCFEQWQTGYQLAAFLVEVLPNIYDAGDFIGGIRLREILGANNYTLVDRHYDVHVMRDNCKFGIEIEHASRLKYEPNFVKIDEGECTFGVFLITTGMRPSTMMQRLENHQSLSKPCFIISKYGVWLWWQGIRKLNLEAYGQVIQMPTRPWWFGKLGAEARAARIEWQKRKHADL